VLHQQAGQEGVGGEAISGTGAGQVEDTLPGQVAGSEGGAAPPDEGLTCSWHLPWDQPPHTMAVDIYWRSCGR